MNGCAFLHGCFTSGLYKKMSNGTGNETSINMYECIANTNEEYSSIASSIAINKKLKHKIMRNIEMRKHLIFQEQSSVDEWNLFFEKQL